MIEIRWHGRGGQGGFTVSRLLGMAASLFSDGYALAFPAFGPERRGAPVMAFTKIDNKKILDRSEIEASDYVVIMDETLISPVTGKGLKPGAEIVINTTNPDNYREIFKGHNIHYLNATQLALAILKRPITNTAMLGALIKISGLVELSACEKSITEEMKVNIQEKNIQVLNAAFESVKKRGESYD